MKTFMILKLFLFFVNYKYNFININQMHKKYKKIVYKINTDHYASNIIRKESI